MVTMMEKTEEFKVSPDELKFLLEQIIPGQESLRGKLRSQEESTAQEAIVRLTRSDAEHLRDALTIQLAATGFDKNYSLNKHGRMLEVLIDRFYLI